MKFRFLWTMELKRWVMSEAAPVLRQDGTLDGYIGSNFDLTEIEKLVRELKFATEAKSEFLANMSHEIRTPMNSIIGFTKRLIKNARPEVSAREVDALETIERNANNLLHIINDVLDLAKIESGKMSLNLSEIDLIEVIGDSLASMQEIR